MEQKAILDRDAAAVKIVTEVSHEEALLKAGALQSAIFNSANFSCIATDAKGVIQLFNVGAERMLGYTAAEVLSKVTPADISDPQELIARAKAMSLELGTTIAPGFDALVYKAARGIEDIYELTKLRKDGSRFPAVVSVTALRDGQAAIIGYLLIGTDNTARKQVEEERKRAEEALRQSEERFRAFVTASSDVVYRMSPDWSEMRQLHGRNFIVDTEKPSGTWFQEYIHPDDQPHVMAVIKEAIRTKSTFELEHRVRRVDGTLGWTFSRAIPLTDAAGEIVEWFGAASDVTERKRAEEALRQSEAKLQTIVENLAEGVAVSDLDGQLLHFNRAALDLHGFVSLDECRRHLTEFADTFELSGMDGKVWPVDQWPLALILRGEKLRNLEVRIRRLQTDWQRVFSYGGTLVHDAGGQPMMAVVTITDITERKRTEEEIRKLNQGLEERVLKRTAELEVANKELEAFSYSVSHDLRAPLRGIAGFSQMLAKTYQGKLDKDGNRWLCVIQSETERMGRLIDELLNFSRLGRQHMKSTPVDMTALAQTVFQELTAQQTEHIPKFDLNPLPPARGDHTLLRQVFVNLLSNAIKFTRRREAAHIEVGARSDGAENLYYVKDNGVGFDAKYSHKLFGVFQRLHHEDEFEGTGVGLALVQRIIHRHGGRIWAEAELNQGATFYFTLPRDKQEKGNS